MDFLTLKRLLTLVGAPLIWFVHFVVCYVVVALVCALQLTEVRVIGFNAAQWGVAATTLIGGALICGIAVTSQRHWRDPPGADPEISHFFAVNTLSLCAISLLSMLWVAFPISILPTCAF